MPACGARSNNPGLVEVVRTGSFYGPAGFGVYVAGPGDGHVGLCTQQLPRSAIQNVKKSIFRCLHNHLSSFSFEIDISEDHLLHGGVVPIVTGCCLIVPNQFCGIGIDGKNGSQVEVVASSRAARIAAPGSTVTNSDVE